MEVRKGFSSKLISHKEKEEFMIWTVKPQTCRYVPEALQPFCASELHQEPWTSHLMPTILIIFLNFDFYSAFLYFCVHLLMFWNVQQVFYQFTCGAYVELSYTKHKTTKLSKGVSKILASVSYFITRNYSQQVLILATLWFSTVAQETDINFNS